MCSYIMTICWCHFVGMVKIIENGLISVFCKSLNLFRLLIRFRELSLLFTFIDGASGDADVVQPKYRMFVISTPRSPDCIDNR